MSVRNDRCQCRGLPGSRPSLDEDVTLSGPYLTISDHISHISISHISAISGPQNARTSRACGARNGYVTDVTDVKCNRRPSQSYREGAQSAHRLAQGPPRGRVLCSATALTPIAASPPQGAPAHYPARGRHGPGSRLAARPSWRLSPSTSRPPARVGTGFILPRCRSIPDRLRPRAAIDANVTACAGRAIALKVDSGLALVAGVCLRVCLRVCVCPVLG